MHALWRHVDRSDHPCLCPFDDWPCCCHLLTLHQTCLVKVHRPAPARPKGQCPVLPHTLSVTPDSVGHSVGKSMSPQWPKHDDCEQAMSDHAALSGRMRTDPSRELPGGANWPAVLRAVQGHLHAVSTSSAWTLTSTSPGLRVQLGTKDRACSGWVGARGTAPACGSAAGPARVPLQASAPGTCVL